MAAGGGAYQWSGARAYEAALLETWSHRDPVELHDLSYLTHYATLAANSHNTQAWRFSLAGTTVSIKPDFTRVTPSADPDDHHLYASLGCAAENLMLAATRQGWAVAGAYAGDAAPAFDIDLTRTGGQQNPLFDAILERQSTRAEYDGEPVEAGLLSALERAAKVEGCEVLLIDDPQQIEQVLDFVLAANTRQVENPAFRRELRSWLRFDGRQAAAARDGLYSACSGNPPLPPLIANAIFDLVFTADAENDKYARQIRSSAGLAVFVSERDDPEHWIAAGRASQRFALEATRQGLRTAFVNQPVEVAELRSQLSAALGLGGRRPDLIMRFGRGPAMPRSLRRPVEAVID